MMHHPAAIPSPTSQRGAIPHRRPLADLHLHTSSRTAHDRTRHQTQHCVMQAGSFDARDQASHYHASQHPRWRGGSSPLLLCIHSLLLRKNSCQGSPYALHHFCLQHRYPGFFAANSCQSGTPYLPNDTGRRRDERRRVDRRRLALVRQHPRRRGHCSACQTTAVVSTREAAG